MEQSLSALEYFFPSDFVASLSSGEGEEGFLHRLLCDQHPKMEVWRKHINGCLELALRYELEDADLGSRLRKGDWETFEAVMNELKCARFMESVFGINSLRWHPQGRSGKFGDFEILLIGHDSSIFVEVKTIFPREMENLEARVGAKLKRYAKQVPVPFGLSVHIKELGKSDDFSGKRFKKFLEGELSKIKLIELPDYVDDKTGLHLKIKAFPIPPKPSRMSYIVSIGGEAKWLKNDDYIHQSLERAYDKQLPKGKRPCLVSLCPSPGYLVDEDDVLNALLGTLSYSYPRFVGIPPDDAKEGPIRLSNGFFHPKHNRYLSAVGVYREKFAEKAVESALEIYHNPFALNLLDPSFCEGKDVRQFEIIGDDENGWKVSEHVKSQ